MPDPLCAYCHKPGPLARDHVIPRSKGGPDNAKNIVMACKSCNSSKGDRLPSEWLGERCPAKVLLVELKQQLKMKKGFEYRGKGKGKQDKLYAFHVQTSGAVDWIGEVKAEINGILHLSVVNAFTLQCGIWELAGEICRAPLAECRTFTDRDTCVEKALQLNDAYFRRREAQPA